MPALGLSPGPASPSSSLLLRLRQHDPEAWQRFLDLYGPLVYEWCRAQWHLPQSDAADVLQEVAIRVLEHLADYRGGSFPAWLWTITRSCAIRHRQKDVPKAAGGSSAHERLTEIPAPGPADADVPPPGSLTGVLARAVERVRSRCAETSWQAFWQVTVDGRRPADVAADLGMSIGTIYVAVSRVTRRLREEIDHDTV